MGGGASNFVSEDKLHCNKKRALSLEYKKHSISSDCKSRNGNSLRAMAKMVHDRQENLFISHELVQDELNTRILKRRSDDLSAQEPKKKQPKLELKLPTFAQNKLNTAKKKITTEEYNFEDAESLITGGRTEITPLQFKFSHLKVSTADSQDQDKSTSNGMNFSETPATSHKSMRGRSPTSCSVTTNITDLSKSSHISSVSVSPRSSLFVSGTEVEVNDEGIVRPLGSTRAGKLPMKERLVMLCKLGNGSSSSVYKALDLHELKLVAVKIIHVNERSKNEQMVSELSALYQLLRDNSRRDSANAPTKFRRPEKYIVDFYDAFSNIEENTVSFMLEYMDGGSLQDIVDMGGCEDESTLANIAVQALKGLNFLHGNDQLHRDLKPANFLISHAGEVKITDLGLVKKLSSVVDNESPGKLKRTNSFVGTATYMSPERIDGKDYGFPADIWAFGLSLLSIALGRLPVDTSRGYWSILNSIRDSPVPEVPKWFSPEFRNFISCCLKRDPSQRWTCAQLLKHPFLNFVTPDFVVETGFDGAREEFRAVLDAICIRIKQVQEEKHHIENSPEKPLLTRQRSQSGAERYDRLFGDINGGKPSEILDHLLFNDFRSQNALIEKVASKRKEIRPKLWKLANQLQLPVDLVVGDARNFVAALKKKEQL